MKILFGITNEETVNGIVDFYKEKYKENLEYKVVFYYKQFIKELNDNKYDRAVLLEELEKFPTDNQAQIDQYLFSNIDAITDLYESKNLIYIASDRRRLGDQYLTKLFNLGIYSVLTGQDRTKGKVCSLINKLNTKKDVKKYYTDTNKSAYQGIEVSEIEIQRIISYYQNQNKVPDKYCEIFDRIAKQYTDSQLKIIIKFLPEDVKQHLSFNSEKYKQIVDMPEVNIDTSINGEFIDSNVKSSGQGIEIKKEPEIIERIVVKEKGGNAPVVTEVLEKEVYQSIYEIPKDYKKVACFVGAPKTGTTFCINAIATDYAKNKINTAIVDVTRKKDSFIIYTYDSEGKRNIAAESLKYASKGLNEPLAYDMLSVYTGTPGEDRRSYNASKIIDTVMQNNSVILIDADFTTPIDYFRLCQEIYIVQDMNVLNLHQTTLFLKELKSKGISMSKIKLIINKHVKCSLTAKTLLEGLRTYTSYDLSMYDELFDSKTLRHYILPFDVGNYKKYIDMLYKYSNHFDSFTDDFKRSLVKIMNDIYPLSKNYTKQNASKKKKEKGFSSILKGFGFGSDINLEDVERIEKESGE